MDASFVDKFIKKIYRVERGEVKSFLIQLAEDKGFLEKVFNALSEGVIVLSQDGNIKYINQASCDFFGLEQEKVRGTHINRQIRGFDWEALSSKKIVKSMDMEIFYPEKKLLNFYLAPINPEKNKPVFFVMLVRDITKRIKEQQLAIEKERFSAITMLAASVAHEIGNPLNSIDIQLQILNKKLAEKIPKLANDFKKHIEISRNEINRLDTLIKQFLGSIRPHELTLIKASLNRIVLQAVKFLENELKDKGILVEMQLDESIPDMLLDTDQMKQAFYNIIRNSMQAMTNKGKLKIKTQVKDNEVVISFNDDGYGISPNAMSKVLDRKSTRLNSSH